MTMLLMPDGPLVVFAVGAHPDDIEIGCGGALLTLAERNTADIRTLVLTGTAERREEATHAATAFGAAHPPRFAGLPDAHLPQHWGEVKEALTTFRADNPTPDLVLVPRADDAHQDHRLLGRMAPTVWRGPLILHYEIPKWDGDTGQPNLYLPLRPDIAARKVALLNECYPSQHDCHWWDDELFFALMRLRGVQAQCRYAEAFTGPKILMSLGE
ncbi:PIG-L deacetylase family protein [Pseudactinotalea sp. Z1732]|uniref:PIG-L deacetylase family protein n=1 Tax=Micrococcales TaxID=85006 RepID=UPI003C7A870C